MKYIYIIAVLCAPLFSQSIVEDENIVKDTIGISTASIEKSGLTQEQIVKLDEQTRILLAEYQSTSKEYDSLKLYNDQVQKIINSQIDEIESILIKIDELDQTNQRIVPFMLRMIDGLENFIQLDLPFLLDERRDRLNNLKVTMDRGDISTSEKFRLIIEAYKTELEYGRTIEAYRDNILIDDVETSADFLRIGRIALTYLTVDGSKGGYWDTNSQSWEKASSSIKRSTADALKVASKQAPPALIKIPVYRNDDE
jgi:FtsZ-binding cell division protein ZapB